MSKVLTKVNNAHNGAGIWTVDWVKDIIITGSMSASITTTASATVAPSTATPSSTGGNVKLWSITGGAGSTPSKLQAIAQLGGGYHMLGITAARFSRSDPLAATASLDGAVRIWDVEVPRVPAIKSDVTCGPSGALCLALCPRGKLAATAGCGPRISLWNVSDGSPATSSEPIDVAPSKFVTALAWAPSGDVIACGTGDGAVSLFKAETGARVWTGMSHSKTVRALAFAEDGSVLFSAGDDGLVNVHDAKAAGSDSVIAAYSGHKGKALAVAAASDGRTCATGGSDAVVKLWDIRAAWKERCALYEHKDNVWGLTFSQDSSMLASVSDDGALIVYSTA